jgi:hypothetical protein
MYKIHFENCPAPAPSPSSRFGPANEVKNRLHCQALRRTRRPSADVATGRGGFSRPALVGADQGACAFLISSSVCVPVSPTFLNEDMDQRTILYSHCPYTFHSAGGEGIFRMFQVVHIQSFQHHR